MKHLADLRNRANSQWYSSIYEDRRPKIEDIERSAVRRVIKDNKVPGTRDPGPARDKGGRRPSPGAGAAAGVLGEGQAEL